MLVLSRQRDESVIINDDVEIKIVDVRGDKVRLGFIAPRTVTIHRKEIYDAIRRENRAAATLQPGDLPKLGGPRPAGGPMVSPQPEPLLDLALEEARTALRDGGLPVGCVIGAGDAMLGRAADRRIQDNSPLRQAPLLAIASLSAPLPADASAYLTSLPTVTAAAALLEAGITRVVVGDTLNYAGGKVRSISAGDLLKQSGAQLIDRHHNGCIALLAEFIREHPSTWQG